MAEVCMNADNYTVKAAPAGVDAAHSNLFVNDDACGDWVIPLGFGGLEFQSVNAMSALLYVIAGLAILFRPNTTPLARGYGLMTAAIGLGSFSFHATTSFSAFLIDIVPMAVTGAIMLFKAVHAVQIDVGFGGETAEAARYFISMAAAVVAVYTPWMMMMTGASHFTVWAVWAFLFGSMGAILGVVALEVFFKEGMLFSKAGRDILVAAVSVLVGLGFTVHSFIPGMCVGWRAALPCHALWHIFSSISANRSGCVLDNLTKLVSVLEKEPQKQRKKGDGLLGRLIKRDAFPSQFSM
eukprot:TRINITY_DN29711_c0_g1_i1.p1 TRINITY_DN29711_c0_g1~~TRINITY_DN29711_c0_g1_i1.p1  ORF type:complete len:296 (-),score=42.79 TRINITY_DN29711_c0_g1_i1:523-1410(-)